MAKKSKKSQLRIISYTYYCSTCSKTFKYILDFDDRLKPYACPTCQGKLKYKGGNDIAVSSTGNCGYISAEKQSDINKKRIGNEQYQKMCEDDPVVQKRIEEKNQPKPWYQDSSGPLDLKTVNNVEKYIMTGDKS